MPERIGEKAADSIPAGHRDDERVGHVLALDIVTPGALVGQRDDAARRRLDAEADGVIFQALDRQPATSSGLLPQPVAPLDPAEAGVQPLTDPTTMPSTK